MKHLILEPNKTVIAVGDTYSTAVDDIDSTRMVHVVNGLRFDQNFAHATAEELPLDFAVGLYKYVDGEFIKNVDRISEIEQQGYDKAVYDIYFGGDE